MSDNKSNVLSSDALFQPNATRAMAFANCCPIYTPTALVRLIDDGKPVLIKDESTRFGLGSFKALGGIYAVAQLLLDTVEVLTGNRPDMTELMSDAVR